MGDPIAGSGVAAAWRPASRLAIVAVLFGVFVTWLADGSIQLDGTQGPNNGWLAVVLALLALPWLRMLERGSWVGGVAILGAGVVIGWTALENWLDARATIGASVGLGLLLVLAGSVVLTAAALARAYELGKHAFRHRAA